MKKTALKAMACFFPSILVGQFMETYLPYFGFCLAWGMFCGYFIYPEIESLGE